MNNYKGFEVKDWLEDLKFRRWVYHGESDLFFKNFTENNPHQVSVMEEARELLLSVRGKLDVISEADLRSRVNEIMESIPEADQPHFQWWKGNWLKVAAMLILTLGVGFGLYKNRGSLDSMQFSLAEKVQPKKAKNIRITNQTDGIQLVSLPDGSSVVLKTNARITYPEFFDKDKREVTMTGEAFFEVLKNPARPFFVYAGSMVTKVKGTSFSIRANEGDDEVKLVVKTGIVEVSAIETNDIKKGSAQKTMLLKPNEQVTFNQKSRSMTASKLPEPVLLDLPVEKQEFEFKRTPLPEVFALLEKTYGVVIRFDADAISSCTLTAKLGDEPVAEKMDMICSVVNARYVLRDGAIAVISQGCD
ncbi:FecR family protein [Dyadobacter aurulentus]|uniref:FecR family protein n=1 Tax=Dyadobacter sp. UC 10 TaxID=2605428 RepID=UPI0011F328E7|nr:FecR family protein [Dyadobacter sp. UC 10]KAA0991230.1 FecR family protein [Dyadobacter sp. UC 10]